MRNFVNQYIFLILIGAGLAMVTVDHIADRLDIELQHFNERLNQ